MIPDVDSFSIVQFKGAKVRTNTKMFRNIEIKSHKDLGYVAWSIIPTYLKNWITVMN